jgi:hypothetical protein
LLGACLAPTDPVLASDVQIISVDTDRKLTRKGLLYRLKIDQVIHVSCLIFRQENLRGDYHGYVCKDTADVLP